MKPYCIGGEIGIHQSRLGIFDVSGRVIKTWNIDTLKGNGCRGVLTELTDSIMAALNSLDIPTKEVAGIGVSVPGIVDYNGIVHYSMPLGWGIVNVSEMLQSLSGIPAFAGGSREMAVLGESWMTKTDDPVNLALLVIGESIHGSMIIDGKLVFDGYGFSRDLGNLSVFQVNSRQYQEFSQLTEYDTPLVEKLLAQMVHTMIQALADIECLVRLDRLCVCGEAEQGLSLLIAELKKAAGPEVGRLKLGSDAGLYGSVRYMLDRIGKLSVY